MSIRNKIQAMSKARFAVLLTLVLIGVAASPYSIAIWSYVLANDGYRTETAIILGVQCVLFIALAGMAWTSIKCRWFS